MCRVRFARVSCPWLRFGAGKQPWDVEMKTLPVNRRTSLVLVLGRCSSWSPLRGFCLLHGGGWFERGWH